MGIQGLLGGSTEKEKELWVGVLSGSSLDPRNTRAGLGCWKEVELRVSSGTSGLDEVGSSSPAKMPRPKVFQGFVVVSAKGWERLDMLAKSSKDAEELLPILSVGMTYRLR